MKLNFKILLLLIVFLVISCNQKNNENKAEFNHDNWDELEIKTRTEKIIISKFSDTANYEQDLNNNAFKILPEIGKIVKEKIIKKKIIFTKPEKDSLAKYIYQSVTNPKFTNVLATDYAGTVKFKYDTGTTKLTCEYNSVGDWSIVSSETRKIYELIRKKVQIMKS